MEALAGGPRRLKIIFLLACVLALDAADKATIGAVAPQLKSTLHINNVQVGLLVTVTIASSALLTFPFGILVDRFNRRNLLVAGIGLWSLAMIVCGLASSYDMLFAARLVLGVVMAIGAPAIASLVGDSFQTSERSRIYGYILAGELVGVAIGFLASGNIATVSWRAPFLLLAVLGLALGYFIARKLPEPRRGGSGVAAFDGETERRNADMEPAGPTPAAGAGAARVKEKVCAEGIPPRDPLVLHEDLSRLPVWQAVKHILSIPTNVILIIASALGYFYFTGLRTFVVVFVRSRFGLPQALSSSFVVVIGLGAIAGVLLAGTLADRLVGKGHLAARMYVGAGAYFVAALALLPAVLLSSLFAAAPFMFIAAGGLGGAYPAVDAARLDIMHPRLWGRAEGVRSTIVYIAKAASPPVFGWLAGMLGEGAGSPSLAPAAAQGGQGGSMDMAFLVLLVALFAAGAVMLFGSKTYLRDVATVAASERAVDQAPAASQ